MVPRSWNTTVVGTVPRRGEGGRAASILFRGRRLAPGVDYSVIESEQKPPSKADVCDAARTARSAIFWT